MPKLFEVFGYPVSDNSPEAEANRKAAKCPFMGRDCDGGGNRYLSEVDLTRNAALQAIYPSRKSLAAGVCSIQTKPDAPPWIVCPRRLLVLGREAAGVRARQRDTETKTLSLLGYPSGTRLGVWPEIKIQYKEVVNDEPLSFHYTFDYILMPLGIQKDSDIEVTTGGKWATLRRLFVANGYTIARRDDADFVEDCPMGTPSVLEIMTSSTSGGNKAKRTTVPIAFEDVILGRPHSAPGINYRQVWARMASQLIVKSEIALNWGGKTVWVVQDALVDYICASTALNVRQFLTDKTNEVNMLSFSYGDAYKTPSGVIELPKAEFFAGPMTTPNSEANPKPSFQDIVRSPICPPLSRLVIALANKRPMNQVIVP